MPANRNELECRIATGTNGAYALVWSGGAYKIVGPITEDYPADYYGGRQVCFAENLAEARVMVSAFLEGRWSKRAILAELVREIDNLVNEVGIENLDAVERDTLEAAVRTLAREA